MVCYNLLQNIVGLYRKLTKESARILKEIARSWTKVLAWILRDFGLENLMFFLINQDFILFFAIKGLLFFLKIEDNS